ncbi:MAG: leucine-rich repeat protein [Bacteroides sp.]|nr:leucine-rich repeat protein [Bacteroides sp.]
MKKIKLIAFLSILLGITACSKNDDKETTVYTITFDTDGGTPVPPAQRVEAGQTAVSPTTNPGKAGYVFVFWYLNDADRAYNFQTPVNNDLTLLAKWQEEATVEYWQVNWNLNGGSWTSEDNHASQVVKRGTLAEPNAPVRSAYTFGGWYQDAALSNPVSFPYDVSSVTNHIILHAKWIPDEGEEDHFASVAGFSTWLQSQPENTPETAYRVNLKDINLDSGNNWGDLGIVIGKTNRTKYIDLDLGMCYGSAIPDGYRSGNTTYGAFVDCDNLVAIKLPPHLISIGAYAFYNCDGLTVLNFPQGLEYIGDYAYCSSNKLTSIHLPEGLKFIGESTFRECRSLTTVTMHDYVETIGTMAFYGDTKLESINLSKRLKSIEKETFAYCDKGLKSITIPESVATIKTWAFYDCEALAEVIMESAFPPYIPNSVFLYTSPSLQIKVPPSSVEVYQAAEGWNEYANKIVPIG